MANVALVNADHEFLGRKRKQFDVSEIATGIHHQLVRLIQAIWETVEPRRNQERRPWHVLQVAHLPMDFCHGYSGQERSGNVSDQSIKGAFTFDDLRVESLDRPSDQIRFFVRSVAWFFTLLGASSNLKSNASNSLH